MIRSPWALLDTATLRPEALGTLADGLVASTPPALARSLTRLSPDEGLPPGVVVGNPHAKRRLLVTSGLHGVEGRFGLLLQARFLASLAEAGFGADDDVAVILLFALNRSGFLESRRWCAGNTDLNRAFVREAGGDDTHPAWDALYAAFGPAAPRPTLGRFVGMAVMSALRFGWRDLSEGLPRGQLRYPDFIFSRDATRAVGVEAIRTRLREVCAGASKVLHVDLHTGLGRAGDAKLLSPTGPLVAACGDVGSAYAAPGTLIDAECKRWAEEASGVAGEVYEGAVLEFGTVPGGKVFYSLLRENHSFQTGDALRSEADRAALLRDFFPGDEGWRTRALAAGLDVLTRARATLTSRPRGFP